MAKQHSREVGLAQEIAEQRRGVTVGVVKVPVTVIERWEAMARELEGLPDQSVLVEEGAPTSPSS